MCVCVTEVSVCAGVSVYGVSVCMGCVCGEGGECVCGGGGECVCVCVGGGGGGGGGYAC